MPPPGFRNGATRLLAPNTYAVAKSSNPNYWVTVSCPDKGIEIVADIPEQFAVSLASEWENRFGTSTGLADAPVVGRAITGGAQTNAVSRSLTKQIWMNSSPFEFPLQILFDADIDAKREVYDPMVRLEAMVLPIGRGEFLTAPGGEHGSAVTLRIGKMFSITNCIITAVNNTYDTKLDANGIPISGQSEITVRTDELFSAQDWLSIRGVSNPS